MGNAPRIPIQDLPNGPWTEEFKKYPEDTYTFEMLDDEKKKYECKVQRMNDYNWNGYVSVPPTHRLKETDYTEVQEEFDIMVHGELTYSDGAGTFGFDTHHLGDIIPVDAYYKEKGYISCTIDATLRPKYWTFEEVKKETEQLARQLMKLH